MDEATALLLTLETTDPTASTACVDWSAHELVAHLAAGAAEMAAHAEHALCGAPEQAAMGLAEREAPFAALETRSYERGSSRRRSAECCGRPAR